MIFEPSTEYLDHLQKAAGAPAKKGPPKELVTKIAVKFVNAMWFTQFHKVFELGLQQYRRTAGKTAANPTWTTAQSDPYTLSVAYQSYLYSSYLLMGWGLFGWATFFAKRFTNSSAVQKIALFALKGNFFVGLAVIGLSAWKTAARDQCSVKAGYYQCWNDQASPTALQTWYNSAYTGQSRASYMLAFQMMWLSHTTTKFLDADLKFTSKNSDKKKAKGDAAAAGGPAPAKPPKERVTPIDGRNGRIVRKNGDVEIVKDGWIIERNGKAVREKETRADKKELEKEQKERNKEIEKTGTCTGWFCL